MGLGWQAYEELPDAIGNVPMETGESEEDEGSVWVEMWDSVVWNRTQENCVLVRASSMGWRKDQILQRVE